MCVPPHASRRTSRTDVLGRTTRRTRAWCQPAALFSAAYKGQGEYLRLQPQDESDNSEPIYAAIATLRFDNPYLKVTGNPTYR